MSRNLERNREWAQRLASGETLQSIGDSVGLTREAVRQALMSDYLYWEALATKRLGDAERAMEKARERTERHRAAVEARKTSMPAVKGSRRRISNEEMIQSMRDWMTQGGSGAQADWPGPGSLGLITMRFGSWNDLRRAAGWPPAKQPSPYKRVWSDAECVEAVADFLCDDDHPFKGAGAYDRWAHEQGDRPSVSLVRIRFGGSWLAAKAAAIRMLGWVD